MFRLAEVDLKGNINKEIEVLFLLKSVSVGKQKNGGQFITLEIADGSVLEEAKIFNASVETKDSLVVGKVYSALVSVNEYSKAKNGVSLIVQGNVVLRQEFMPESFLEWITGYELYIDKLKDLFSDISDTIYGNLAYDVLSNNWDEFSTFGAAKSNHHTALGGLLMHSVCTAESASLIAEYYNKIYGGDFINVTLVTSAALIHDIGKVKELNKGPAGMDYSVFSSLTTHIVESAIELERSAQRLNVANTFEYDELKHCILAHHSKLEWGSPITPSCPEAWILSKADELDAEMNKFNREFKNLGEHDRKAIWSPAGLVNYYKPTRDGFNLEI